MEWFIHVQVTYCNPKIWPLEEGRKHGTFCHTNTVFLYFSTPVYFNQANIFWPHMHVLYLVSNPVYMLRSNHPLNESTQYKIACNWLEANVYPCKTITHLHISTCSLVSSWQHTSNTDSVNTCSLFTVTDYSIKEGWLFPFVHRHSSLPLLSSLTFTRLTKYNPCQWFKQSLQWIKCICITIHSNHCTYTFISDL